MNGRSFPALSAGPGIDRGHRGQGEGYGPNRSREGPNTSSPRRRPAERGRHRAGAPRLARSKGPAGHRDDDGRQQVTNSICPRPRPHGLIPAEPLLRYPAPDDGGLDRQQGCGCTAGRGRSPERKTPPRAGLKYWDERTQRVVELVPPAPMLGLARGSGLSIKNFGGRSPARDRMKSRRQRGSLFRSSPRGVTPRRSRRGDPVAGTQLGPGFPLEFTPAKAGAGMSGSYRAVAQRWTLPGRPEM
jgi:hypothetical protein